MLKANFEDEQVAARIGGDEFAVILPDADEQAAVEAVQHLHSLVELNNKYYRDPELSLSIGMVTSRGGLSLEKVFSQADDAMHRDKAGHHRRRSDDMK